MRKNGYMLSVAGIILFAAVAASPAAFAKGVSKGLVSCAETVIPSLFGFTAAAGLLGAGELPERLKKAVSPAMKLLFGLPAECLPALLLGLFGGYPTGAAAARTLSQAGKISVCDARRLISFCLSPGMGFCVNAVGISMLSSRRAGLILLASITAATVPLGTAAKYIVKSDSATPLPCVKSMPFSRAAVECISYCSNSMLSVCTFVSLFSGLAASIEAFTKNETLCAALIMLSEVTNGCLKCAGKVPLYLLCAECAFGGLCVHMQVFALSGEAEPDKKYFFPFRIIHALTSAGICKILLHFFPISHQALAVYSQSRPWSHSAPASVSLLFLSALLILDLDTQRKKC